MGVLDVVEVPAPCLVLGSFGEGVACGEAWFDGVVTEDGDGPDGVGSVLVACAVELVEAEDVFGALTGGDGPVFAFTVEAGGALVTVVGAGGVGDGGGVVVLQAPLARLVVLDEFGGLAVEDE